jgi:chromosome segregation protein
VVGPNGCGKSNLVEALRWVMGESSFKNMRASGMDDVIFAGSGQRPARNMAEVALVLDNAARRAPAQFNETDTLEVTRRIEREEGSTYRVNGREVRARDVQLLFADASTGARSPALVRQGQIAEIISARPQSRRRILEEAAGISGLHSRRHEAELRLRAAEDNLARLEDVLREIETQAESLRRQARQAERYRALSAEIRRAEALIALIQQREALQQEADARRLRDDAVRDVADATTRQGEAAREQAVTAHALPAAREAEAASGAALTRLIRARDELEAEDRRNRQRAADLERRIGEIARDLAREEAARVDAVAALERLDEERASLTSARDGEAVRVAQAAAAHEEAEQHLAVAEAAFAEAQGRLADHAARRAALERSLSDARGRMARHLAEKDRLSRDLQALDASEAGIVALDALRAALDQATEAAETADASARAARAELAAAREAEQKARGPQAEAERKAQRLETEARTLAKLLTGGGGGLWPPVLDEIVAGKGYEVALGAALGDDLDASSNPSAPAHWRESGEVEGDPALPGDCEPLSRHVRAPAALARRLNQIGVVARADGARVARYLRPGQRIVSREGDLWRWDGLVTAAEAPTPAARRLAEKNRLGDLQREAESARREADAARAALDAAGATVRAAVQAEIGAVQRAEEGRRIRDANRERLGSAERKQAEAAARRAGLVEAIGRLASAVSEAELAAAEAEASLSDLAAAAELESALSERRLALAEVRTRAAETRAARQAVARDVAVRAERVRALEGEAERWRARIARNADACAEITTRRSAAEAELALLAEAPDTYLVRRREILAAIEQAEERRRQTGDALAEAEARATAADKAARAALDALATARERRAVLEARLEGARARMDEARRSAADAAEGDVGGLEVAAGIRAGESLPVLTDVERRVANLRGDRERLGAVNLRAEEELAEVQAKGDALVSERDDLNAAIRRLRQAIGALNREGRERLLAAFEVVNAHFQRLFGVLFGGGEAELSLVDADDPLEAGLEIVARPPGKKPQTMTLLSGGEQALTATALIFAVFLTNPSPICVLDEVDAPLDDANVERYCDLLRDMVTQTETRFIVITHNPITMARMDRLFGVTMAERGVSQLVSVDLETAERIREAAGA